MPDFMLESTDCIKTSNLNDFSTLQLAQALSERLTISPNEWHKLKSNRKARSREQAAAALVFLLKDQPEEALLRLQQATAWLDRSISAPPCPSHGSTDLVK
ncbi:DUF6439 family protein [Synechocystis sp. PCC 7509]|uniref:DUF6439 family protein n=1 Tax=Synechocystis sp. PCC 7509 TaxID=927677 RepID=UPI0002ACA74A|nr:DUF6439 family protein [Synechocystis sp. PCC 7509]